MNNDILRSIRYMLDISDTKIIDIIKLAHFDVEKADVIAYLKKEDDEGYQPCSDEVMAYFLEGLVIFKRGKDDSKPTPPLQLKITNNIVLKKLRVAFELKEEDMHAILKAADFAVSKPELSALFRKEGQNNYRNCGDQLLRNFLKGLTLRVRS